MRIVVPLDGSPLAEYALGSAATLARGMPDSTLILMHVVEISLSANGNAEPFLATAVTESVLASNVYLNEVALRPSVAGVRIELQVVTNSIGVARTIIEASQKCGAELIVLTSHGRTGLLHLVMGSVAEQVAHDAQLPVLVLRVENDQVSLAKPVPGRPFTILATLDGSHHAEAILIPVMRIARALQAEVRLLQVLPRPTGDARMDSTRLASAEAYLHTLRDRLGRQGIVSTISVAFGDPAEQIAHKAQDTRHSTDLIAIATHGHSGVERLAIGSVTDQIVRQVRLPLLILRPPQSVIPAQNSITEMVKKH